MENDVNLSLLVSLIGDPMSAELINRDIYDDLTRKYIRLLLRRYKQKLEVCVVDKLLTLKLTTIMSAIIHSKQDLYEESYQDYIKLVDKYSSRMSCNAIEKLSQETDKKPKFDARYWRDKWERSTGYDAATLRPLSKKRREELA